MVLTDNKLKNLPPDERIKRIKKLQEKRKSDLKKKKDDIEKKKLKLEKEIEKEKVLLEEKKLKLEKEVEKEIFSDNAEIDESVEELIEEEKESFEKTYKKRLDDDSLEDSISKEDVSSDSKSSSNISYESPLEKLGSPSTIYELSNYNLYGEIKRIKNKGYVTPEEQRFLLEVEQRSSGISSSYSSAELKSKDPNDYINRTASLIKDLTADIYKGKGDIDFNAVYK